MVKTFRIASLTLVLDDTLSPKWGRGIFGTAFHFDHTARPRAGYIWGHNWVVLAVVVQVGARAWVALPFWVALYRPKKTCQRGQFRTRHEMAAEALGAVRGWFSGPILLLADGAYANKSLVGPARKLDIHMVSRLRADAHFREPTTRKRPKGKRGRKPTHGPWLPRLSQLARQRSKFATFSVAIYGKTVTLRLREVVAWWPPLAGLPERKSQVPDGQRVLVADVNDPLGGARREGADYHAFDDTVGVAFQDAAVHVGAGVAFVGVTDQALAARTRLPGQPLPLEARRESAAA